MDVRNPKRIKQEELCFSVKLGFLGGRGCGKDVVKEMYF